MSNKNNSNDNLNSDNSNNKVISDNSTNDNKKSIKNFFKISLIIIISIALIGFITVAGFAFAIIKTSPPLTIEAVTNLDQASQLFDSNGEFMDEVLTAEKRYVISLDEIPLNLRNAFIAIEDERFYSHSGIDLQRIIGAVLTDIKKIINKEEGLHGASTITQQVIKNNILTNEVSIIRKIREIYLALELEKQMSKDEILQIYLNTIFVGGNAYGVEAGALQYFSKNARDITLTQAAFLAGSTQHPTRYYSSVVSENDKQFYKNRTILVLGKMLELGYISQEEYDNSVNEVNEEKIGFEIKKVNDSYNYEWFARPVVEELTKDLKEVYGYTDEEIKLHLRNDGLKIYTTMDKDLQNHSQEIVNNATNYINLAEWTDENGVIQPQISSVIIDFKTGHVKSIIGGRGEQAANSYNRAASMSFLRSIGSTTKPLTAYTPLIDLKLGHAGTGVEDSPLSKELSSKYGGWNPTNEVKGSFLGYTNVRYSLERSINLSSIKTVDLVGIKNSLEYGENFGLIYNDNSKSSIATLALGQFNNDPSNLDGGNTLILAAAYSVFANGGVLTEPITYTHVVDKNGKVILENVPETNQVVSHETAYIMYDLLKGPVERYSSRPAKFGSIPVAGKTGTTENNKDLWFAGITPYMAGAVWIGADLPTELTDKYGNKPYSGATASALFGKIMQKAHEGLPPIDIPRPENVVSASICSVSGMLATANCSADPRGSKVYTELFIRGTVPSHTCDIHVPVAVNSLTGAIATANTPSYLRETRVYLNRKYTPSVYLNDQKYVIPKVYDDAQYELPDEDLENGTEPDEDWFQNPENNNNNNNNTSPPSGGNTTISTPDTDGSTNGTDKNPELTPPSIVPPDNSEDKPNDIIPPMDNEDKTDTILPPTIDNNSTDNDNNNSTPVIPPNNDNNTTITPPPIEPNPPNTNDTSNNNTNQQPESNNNNSSNNGTSTIEDNNQSDFDSADFDFGY